MKNVSSFIFTADLHLKSDRYETNQTRQDSYKSFTQIINFCISEGKDLVIGGDFFDSPTPDSQSVDLALKQFVLLSGAGQKIYWVDGNHDRAKLSWGKVLGATLLDGYEDALMGSYPGGVLTVGINSCSQQNLREKLKLVPTGDKGPAVLICHQLLDLTCPMDGMWNMAASWVPEYVKQVVMGDYHVRCSVANPAVPDQRFDYSGSVAMMSISEQPDKYFLEVIKEDGKVRVEQHELEVRPFRRFEIGSESQFTAAVDEYREFCKLVKDSPNNELYRDELPVIYVVYSDRLENLESRITEVVNGKALIRFKRVVNSEKGGNKTPSQLKQSAQFVLDSVVNQTKQPQVYAMAKELISDNDTAGVIDRWRKTSGIQT